MIGTVENVGLIEYVLYIYSTKKLTQTEKVKFHYFLKGRNGHAGFLEQINGKHLSAAALLVHSDHSKLIEDELKNWKIPFEKHHFYKKDE